MNEPPVLAIDLGTSAVKCALVSADGRVLSGTRRLLHGANPAGWYRTALRAARETLAATDRSRVQAIGLSGRGGATILCDAVGRALAPAATGVPPPEYAPGAPQRLRLPAWRVEQALAASPAIERRLRWLLAAKDYLLLRLGGVAATDPASGPDALRWPAAGDASGGLLAERLPAVHLPWQCAGGLQPAAAAALGLPAGLPIATGLHDGVAAQVGAGVLQPGDAALTLGTHLVVRVVCPGDVARAVRFRFYRLWGETDERTVYGANARLAGAAAGWAARLIGAGERSLPALERTAAAVPAGSRGLLFLPYLGGMAYPQRRPELGGALLGLRAEQGRGELFRAVLEGAACAVRHNAEALAAAGIDVGTPTLTGGGARSPLWRQILADTLARPLACSAAPEFAECLGAARCAWVALGRYPSLDAAVAVGAAATVVCEPTPAGMTAADALFDRFREAIASIAPVP
ncbi:MAG TPA: FGGY-family carbohydrate kinase [Dehalococcoidia bacterium]|nr:FGGY-family carbohydrate kinase [Dehalococcoidia bacterium]